MFRRFSIQVIHMRSHVEKALGSQEKTGAAAVVERQAQGFDEWVDGVIAPRGIVTKVAVSTLPPKSIVRSDSFQERGFTRPVLTRKEANPRPESQFSYSANCDDRERVDIPVLN